MALPTLTGIPRVDALEPDGKRVLVRVDFDAPNDEPELLGLLVDAALPTLRTLLTAGARVMVAAHHSAAPAQEHPESCMEAAGLLLAEKLECEVVLPEDVAGDAARKVVTDLRKGQLALLENLLLDPGEVSNDDGFAKRLAALTDIYVNDAPALLDRKWASLVKVPRLTAISAIGLDLAQALSGLRQLATFQTGLSCLFGGEQIDPATFSTLEAWLSKTDTLVVTGKLAELFARAERAGAATQEIDEPEIAHCRSVIAQARAQDVTVVVIRPNDSQEQALAVLTQKLPPGPLVLIGPLAGQIDRSGLESLLARQPFVALAGPLAVRSVSQSAPDLIPRFKLNSISPQLLLKTLKGEPLPALLALDALA